MGERESTKALAKYVVGTRYEDLSEELIAEAKRRTADVLAIGLSGSTTSSGKAMRAFSGEVSHSAEATLWGGGAPVSADIAALANATMAFHLELDDVHRTSHTHPGISVIPAALAVCEKMHLDAGAYLTAVVVGYDVVTRVGMAVSPSIYVDRVFLAPGTLAPLGAAAAVANLYRLNETETERLLGAAAFLSPLVLFEAFTKGAPIKNIAMGWGNLIGIWGAKLCAEGLWGPATGIEGEFGYAKATADVYDLEKIEDPFNVNHGILNTGIKPYSCCRQHHSAVDAMLELRERYNLKPEQVERVVVRTFAVASRGKHQRPDTIAGATYSCPFSVATALITGSCWREQYTEQSIRDPEVLDLAQKIDVVKDDELDSLYDEKWPAVVEVATKDGRLLSARRDIMKGEPEYPVTDDELKRKFTSLATDAVSSDHAERLWQAIFRLEEMRNMRELTALLSADKS